MNMRCASAVLALLAAGVAPPALGTESNGSAERAARYYAAGLQQPLLQVRAGSQIVATCQGRFRAKCSKRHREAARRAGVTLEYLDALTLFPERPTTDPTTKLARYPDLIAALDQVNESIVRAAGEYDHALFARYGATLSACPPENLQEFRASLLSLAHQDFRMFGLESDDQRARVLQSVADQEASLAQTFGDAASPDDCIAARQLGELLMTMMSAKLAPWSLQAADVPDPDAARGIANEFLFQAATELELIVNPAARERLETIAQRMNDGEPVKPAPEKSGLSLHW
jgi:hypothetical protein